MANTGIQLCHSESNFKRQYGLEPKGNVHGKIIKKEIQAEARIVHTEQR